MSQSYKKMLKYFPQVLLWLREYIIPPNKEIYDYLDIGSVEINEKNPVNSVIETRCNFGIYTDNAEYRIYAILPNKSNPDGLIWGSYLPRVWLSRDKPARDLWDGPYLSATLVSITDQILEIEHDRIPLSNLKSLVEKDII